MRIVWPFRCAVCKKADVRAVWAAGGYWLYGLCRPCTQLRKSILANDREWWIMKIAETLYNDLETRGRIEDDDGQLVPVEIEDRVA